MRRAVFILTFGLLLTPITARAADEASAPAVPATRPAALIPLYVSHIALQGFDTYSTLAAMRTGAGAEQNPLVGGLAKSPAAFIAVKGGVTVASIVAAERLWRGGHRADAIMTIAVANGVMAAVAINNANTLRRVR